MRGCGSLKTADAFLADGDHEVVVASSLSRPNKAIGFKLKAVGYQLTAISHVLMVLLTAGN